MIAIVGSGNSKQTEYITEHLEDDDWILIDTSTFPNSPSVTFDGTRIQFGDIDAASIGAYFVEDYHSDVDEYLDLDSFDDVGSKKIIAYEEKSSFLKSILRIEAERGKYVINRPEVEALHRRKPYQLYCLQQAGLPTPETVHTNDADAVRSTFNEEFIYKSTSGIGKVGLDTKADLAQREETLNHAPVTFQEFVTGADLRAYVLEDEVVAAIRIESSNTVDYRGNETHCEQITLDEKTAQSCITAANVLGMRYTGVDVRHSEDGYAILECNPMAYFAGVETYLGESIISKPLACVLCEHSEPAL